MITVSSGADRIRSPRSLGLLQVREELDRLPDHEVTIGGGYGRCRLDHHVVVIGEMACVKSGHMADRPPARTNKIAGLDDTCIGDFHEPKESDPVHPATGREATLIRCYQFVDVTGPKAPASLRNEYHSAIIAPMEEQLHEVPANCDFGFRPYHVIFLAAIR
jgi:hypothetical protein